MFKGSLPALITPFQMDGTIDFASLSSLVEWHIETGSDGLILFGSTGEGLSLRAEEKWAILRQVIDCAAGRIPIIASTGSASTWETVENTKVAKEMGADGCQVIVPYYVKPGDEGVFLHFHAVSKIGLPTILYHHPGRTGAKLSSLVLSQISLLPNIVGMKEASGDLEFDQELINKCKTALLSGEDFLTCELMKMGAAGSISVMANLIPKEWKEIVSQKNEVLLDRYKPLMHALFATTNPQGIKYAMSRMELCLPDMRLPLTPPCMKTQERIEEEMEKLGMIRSLSMR